MENLKSSFLTNNLTQFELKIVADAMYLRKFSRGDLIIRQGDEGLEYFVMDKGTVEVVVYKPDTEIKDHQEILRNKSKIAFSKFLSSGGFGEIALLYNEKRTATVRAAT